VTNAAKTLADVKGALAIDAGSGALNRLWIDDSGNTAALDQPKKITDSRIEGLTAAPLPTKRPTAVSGGASSSPAARSARRATKSP